MEAMDEARRHGKRQMSISVVLENARAKELYERMGAKYERSFVYYFDKYPVSAADTSGRFRLVCAGRLQPDTLSVVSDRPAIQSGDVFQFRLCRA